MLSKEDINTNLLDYSGKAAAVHTAGAAGGNQASQAKHILQHQQYHINLAGKTDPNRGIPSGGRPVSLNSGLPPF